MRFSVIIPTMWQANDMLLGMVHKYARSASVGEILIINNAPEQVPEWIKKYSKIKRIRLLNDGTNLYVNPSWNLGAVKAKCDALLIANDDIHVPDIDHLLPMLLFWLREGIIIGPSKHCFVQKQTRKLLPWDMNNLRMAQKREYGFGVFMAVLRSSYMQIPEELKVWFGDSYLFDHLTPYVFETEIKTPMRSTSRNMDLQAQHAREKKFYAALK